MKISKGLLIILCLVIVTGSLNAGTTVTGRLRTHLYGWQNRSPADQDNLRWYQSLVLSASELGTKNLSFHTFLRTAHELRSDIDVADPTRIYHAYFNWKNIGNVLDLRLGRQFVHFGAGSATLDGIRLTIQGKKAFSLQLFYGAEAPFSRKAELQSLSDDRVLGGYLSTSALARTRIGISYVQKNRDGEVRWKQMGLSVDRAFGSFLTVLGKFDYNLDTSDLHEALFRIRFQQSGKWAVYSDLGRRNPRFDADSFFWIFDPQPYDWMRFGARYFITQEARISAEYRYTKLESEQASRMLVALDYSGFSIGMTNRTGIGGSQLGLYGGYSQKVGDKFSLGARVNFSRYDLEEIVGDYENALFSYLRIGYQPTKTIRSELSVQHLTNPRYDREIRVLGTFIYAFKLGG